MNILIFIIIGYAIIKNIGYGIWTINEKNIAGGISIIFLSIVLCVFEFLMVKIIQ